MNLAVRSRAIASAGLARLALVGADPGDDEDRRSSKALLVRISVLILPISLVWGSLYVALGATSGLFAFAYFAVSIGAIAVFARVSAHRGQRAVADPGGPTVAGTPVRR